jgi:N utilization substance protein B
MGQVIGKKSMELAIEMAKKYSTEKSGPFVNGVLDAVLKKLRADGRRTLEQQ